MEALLLSITTKDLARMCGVSRTTVHRALNDTGRINPQTQELILKTAKENGYRPDLLARGLVKGQTFYIGVVVLDVNNRYFSQLLSAIEAEARSKGYFVNITLHEKNKNMEREQLERLADYRMDGIILSSVNKGDEYKEFLTNLNIPIVSINNKIADGIPFVGIQEHNAAREATESMIQAGYQNIVFVCPPLEDRENENIYVHEEREAGFLEAVGKSPEIRHSIIGTLDHYSEQAYEILKSSKEKTAFFCTGDMFALELMKFLKQKGLQPPVDYGLQGFDYIDMLEYVSPKLSTVYNSVEEVAKEAMNLLFDLMNEQDTPKERILGYKRMEGNTF